MPGIRTWPFVNVLKIKLTAVFFPFYLAEVDQAKWDSDGLDEAFIRHITSVLGGAVKHSVAVKHTKQYNLLLQMADCRVGSPGAVGKIMNLINTNMGSGKWNVNTIRAYLNSLNKLCTFVIQMKSSGMNTFQGYDLLNINLLLTSISVWNSSLNKSSAHLTKERMRSADRSEDVTPHDFRTYLDSSRTKAATDILDGKVSVPPTQTNFCLVRNHIIMKIILSNPQRSGCILNMTMQAFVKATIKNGHHIIQVKDHKTSRTYGAADLVLDSSLHSHVSKYIHQFRPETDSPYVLINWSGKKMAVSSLNNALSTELKAVGVNKK